MINVSSRRCRNHLVWASLARWVTRLFTRFKVDVVFLCGSCPRWQRPTDGYVINSTWVIFPLHHTRRLRLHRLMNHFIDVTNISASFLGGEIMVEKWDGVLCGVPQTDRPRRGSFCNFCLFGCSVYVWTRLQKRCCVEYSRYTIEQDRTLWNSQEKRWEGKLFSSYFFSFEHLASPSFPLGIINLTQSN